jgi:hypothetical protein
LTRKKLLVAGAAIAAAASTALVGSQKICACGDPQVGDQTPPSVSVDSPSSGAEVSGTISVTAVASDDVGVVGVQFKRAGSTNIGSEDTSAPFAASFDTTAVSNGSVSLTAVARDAAGNTTTSSALSVTVNNTIASGNAHIWVDTDGGTCVDNASAVAYATATACASLTAAVAAADAGDSVKIRAGSYSFQTLAVKAALQDLSPGCDPHGIWGSASSANCVKIEPDGGDVFIRGMDNHASSLWFKGTVTGTDGAGCGDPQDCSARGYNFHVTNSDLIGNPPPGADDDAFCNCNSVRFRSARPNPSTSTTNAPDHVIVDGLDVDSISVYGSEYVHWKNVDAGPIWADTATRGERGSAVEQTVVRATGPGVGLAPANLYIEGLYLHESNRSFWCDVNNACHPDGWYVSNGGPITIKNSGFSQIAGEPFFFESFNEGTGTENIHDMTIENNWMSCKVNSYPDAPGSATTTCGSGPAIDIKNCGSAAMGGCENWLVRYNSWSGIGGAEVTWTNARFIGNAGRQPSNEPLCTQATWTYNAWYTVTGGQDCGVTNVNTGSSSATTLFTSVTPGSEDFHLAGAAGSTDADNLVSPTTSDYTLTTDFEGDSRTPTTRDAGADER